MSDYRRPADYQVKDIYECQSCRREYELESFYDHSSQRCQCGGTLVKSGETYPANSEDWHEERDSVHDDWRNPSRNY